MMSWVHTRAKSRLSWQNYVQEVVCKKADRKNATPEVAERPSKQARPRFQSLRWKNNALWSQRSNLSERLPSIDEDISSGAVISGPPINKSTAVYGGSLLVATQHHEEASRLYIAVPTQGG